MTTIRRNAGSNVVLGLRFYGPPLANGDLGNVFDLADWQVSLFRSDYRIVQVSTVSVDDAANGQVTLRIDAADLSEGAYPFRLQLTRSDGFDVGFSVVNLSIGDYSSEDFDGEPPYLLLSGKNGVQVTIAPSEPEVIFGVTPNVVTYLGEVVTNGGVPVTYTP